MRTLVPASRFLVLAAAFSLVLAGAARSDTTPGKTALGKTVAWYRDNRWWWEKVKSGDYAAYYQRQYGERLARARAP